MECCINPIIYIFMLTISGMDYIKQHMDGSSLQPADARSSSSDKDDFFLILLPSQAQDSSKQPDGYLACSADHTDLLKSFKAVCKLSVKLNTPLPASAACEMLFNIAWLVFGPRRARLNSRNFENRLLLKMNRKYFSFKYWLGFTVGKDMRKDGERDRWKKEWEGRKNRILFFKFFTL